MKAPREREREREKESQLARPSTPKFIRPFAIL